MPYSVTPVALTGAANLIVAAESITGFTADSIEASGATWQTAGVVQGDAVLVAGSTSNDGSYIVLSVRSETELEVYPGPTVEAAAGTAEIRSQDHLLTIEDEGPTVLASSIATAVAAIDSRLFFESDKFPLRVVKENPGSLGGFTVYKHLFRRIHFNETTDVTTTLRIIREIWASAWMRDASPSTLETGWAISQTGGTSGHLIFQMGQREASDLLATKNGGMLIGGVPRIVFGESMVTKIYNSVISGPGNYKTAALGSNVLGEDAEICNSIIEGGILLFGFGDVVIRRLTFSSSRGGAITYFLFSGSMDADELLIASLTALVNIASTDTILQGVTLSSDVPGTPIQVGSSHLVLDDPGRDLDIKDSTLNSGAHVMKRYRFNPRFVDVNPVGSSSPLPGLRVAIEKIPDGRYVDFTTGSASEWIITINGVAISFTPSNSTLATASAAARFAINAAAVAVTAFLPDNASQWTGASSGVLLLSDVEDTPLTVELTQTGSGGAWVLDPAPSGEAAQAPDDILSGPIPGSPFTTDANGRIDTDGVLAIRSGKSETNGARAINVRLDILVEGPHVRTHRFVFTSTAPYDADFPILVDHMGALR